MEPRERWEEWEREHLSPYATLACRSRGRAIPEDEDELRTCFQRDRDRVLHSKAFRRLKHKTQVFIAPEGDHYRTRLTHTLEVAQIARTIARALRLNEDLTEAIVLAHDLGHPPFGHAGEEILDKLMADHGGFRHYEQSLRVVQILETRRRSDGTVVRGLNLTWEVLDGIRGHSKGLRDLEAVGELGEEGLPSTLEGQVARIADRIAYVHHDTDDAIRAHILREEDVPGAVKRVLGETRGKWLDTLVKDLVHASTDQPVIQMSEEVRKALNLLKDFLTERVYMGSEAKAEVDKAQGLLARLFEYYLAHPEAISQEYRALIDAGEEHRRVVCDFLAGMTDRYAIRMAEQLFIPKTWAFL
jgi:dGTPase